MKRFIVIALLFISRQSLGQYQGPIPALTSGYGANGNYSVAVETFQSPLWPDRNVEIFYPKDIANPQPVIFFSHGYSANKSDYYSDLFKHIASRGYVLVFSPYRTDDADDAGRYHTLFEGFRKAVHDFPEIIDSTRVGFMGHSFGGGATPDMAIKGFGAGWGANSKFLMMLAPWYALEITEDQLQSFPADTKLLVQVYEDDDVNDHRMAIDIFENISIPDAEKDYVMVSSDTISGYVYSAYHNLSLSATDGVYGETDAYDAYAVYRLFDALADYAFTGNTNARDIALGKGNAVQLNMGQLKPLREFAYPVLIHPQIFYQFPCGDTLNPRIDYCETVTGWDDLMPVNVILYPNPDEDEVYWLLAGQNREAEINVLEISGRSVLKARVKDRIDISSLSPGFYILSIEQNNRVWTQKLIKK